jgi:hypothetical protein
MAVVIIYVFGDEIQRHEVRFPSAAETHFLPTVTGSEHTIFFLQMIYA